MSIPEKEKGFQQNAKSLDFIGEPDSSKIAQNSVININLFLEHYSEVLTMKEQVKMIRGMLAA